MSCEVDEFGPNQLVIRKIPVVMMGCKIGEWIQTILESFNEFGGVTEWGPDQKEALQLKACKAAIKAGKKLTDAEVRRLLEDFMAAPSNFTCPHGRPLFVRWDKEALEKMVARR